jgi:hypothetical protein
LLFVESFVESFVGHGGAFDFESAAGFGNGCDKGWDGWDEGFD